MSGSVILILAGAVAHFVAGRWVDSPWVLPDLTLVGICLAVSRPVSSSMEVILLAGLLPMLASQGHSWDAGLGYAGAAALWRWAGSRWDLADWRVSLGAAAVLESSVLAWWICRSGAWSAELWVAVPLRLAGTVASLAVVGWLLSHRSTAGHV